jgi:hypothetical protein
MSPSVSRSQPQIPQPQIIDDLWRGAHPAARPQPCW